MSLTLELGHTFMIAVTFQVLTPSIMLRNFNLKGGLNSHDIKINLCQCAVTLKIVLLLILILYDLFPYRAFEAYTVSPKALGAPTLCIDICKISQASICCLACLQ